jgi:RimJ/RimL family protein N-acetyltransferase
MGFVAPITLAGEYVSVEPLARTHLVALQEAAADGELWKLWYTSVPTVESMSADIDYRMALRERGAMMPFVVRRNTDQKIIGATTYMNIVAEHRRVEIGSTWYAKSAQRQPINTEAKLLLLSHAFEKLDCIAVEFRTNWHNRQSRAAIERLGAKLDGVLRSHMLGRHGELRDTCVYSITAAEWPTVKLGLRHKLGAL